MSTERATISVIVPTWNRSTMVARLARSLLERQCDRLFELIVVDDGSSDDTIARLATIDDPRLRLVARPHSGVCAARNAGATMASSEWLVFLDSDDQPDDTWIARFREMIRGDVDLVSVGQRKRSDDGSIVTIAPPRLGPAFGGLTVLWQAGAFAIRAELFDEVGRYRPSLAFSENTDLGFRVARRHDVQPVRVSSDPDPTYTVRLRPDRYDPELRLDSAEEILVLHHDRLTRQPELLATYEAMAGVAAHKLGRRPTAVRHLAKAVRAQPGNPVHGLRLVRAMLG